MSDVRFLLFTDDETRARIACFGGAEPVWAAIVSHVLTRLEVDRALAAAVPGCKALGCFFDRTSIASKSMQHLHSMLLDQRKITGLDATQLRGLSEWLQKNGRVAGEPVATLIASGVSALSVSQKEAA